MAAFMMEKKIIIKELMNGSIESIKNVVPIEHKVINWRRFEETLCLQMGVLIGITGDVKGQLVIASEAPVFSGIGERMFGMPLEGEMLSSFSGELGNMIAGRLSANVIEKGIQTDITPPTILQGDTTLTGYRHALQVSFAFHQVGKMDFYLLID